MAAARAKSALSTGRRARERSRLKGFTLVELMVALTLGLLVAGAAVAALLAARLGFNSVDGSSQLRENVRFATSLIERIANETGFQNISYGAFPSATQPPALSGYDNAKVELTQGQTAPPTYTAGGVNNSDVLVLSVVGASKIKADGSVGDADGSMINCAGTALPQDPANPGLSIFHIVTSTSGEPTLACTSQDPTTRQWRTVPIVSGVESFQVLYGTDGVTFQTAPPPLNSATTLSADSVPDHYFTAPGLTVNGSVTDPGTLDNWRRVRSLRIGMVLRGLPSSAIDRNATAQAFAVLGSGFTASTDPGSTLTIASADGRLRQQVTFTVHFRNTLNLRSLLPLP